MRDLVTYSLLEKNKICNQNINLILENMHNKKVDLGDIYFQSIKHESWILENNIIKKGEYNFKEGFGMRIIKNKSTSFSYADSINLKNINHATNMVFKMLPHKSIGFFFKKNIFFKKKNLYKLYDLKKFFFIDQKINILHKINYLARKEDKRVVEVFSELSCNYEKILICSTDQEKFSCDIRPLVRISIRVIVEENGKREKGCSGGGGRFDLNYLLNYRNSFGDSYLEHWSKEAVRIALISLSAKLAPSGSFPVVLGPGWPGIIFHEAVGHGLEGDFIRKNTSVFSNKKNTKVASSLCTVVDNGLLKNSRGSISIDDEGVSGQYNILIKDGILKTFLQDKLNAHLMGLNYTGNGRRQSYAHLPLPRMTNTYLLPGINKPEDIISSVNYGIYAVNFSGGQVDITSGNFVFFASEAYILKKGKISYPIKGVMLIGSGSKTMKLISMIADDLKMDDGIGFCGKDGQNVPVSVGQPTIKVDSLTIGGSI